MLAGLRFGGPYVIWLDDLERFMGADGLSSQVLERCIRLYGHKVAIVATMRLQEYVRYGGHGESAVGSGEREIWRNGRDVLRLAVKVRMDRLWSQEERGLARGHSDARVQKALGLADRFGVAEILAAGPQLVEAWHSAWVPGANPRGAALVQVAVDARRSGIHAPLARETLVSGHRHYLDVRGGTDLAPESLVAAFEWAQRPTGSAVAGRMLISDGRGRFRCFDYLVDALGRDLVPDRIWELLLANASPEEAMDMGLVSLTDSFYLRARAAFEKAASAGLGAADVALATVLGKTGQTVQAVAGLRVLVADRINRLGPEHPETLDAHAQLAYFECKQGNFRIALELLTSLHAIRSAVLGPDHPDTLDTELWIALNLGRLGNPIEARDRCSALLGRFEEALGPSHIDVLDVRARLAWWTGKCGEYAKAERLSRALLDDRVRLLGRRHVDTLYARSHLIVYTLAQGRDEEALRLAQALARDRAAYLGVTHPHTLHTRRQVARFLSALGHPDEAALTYAQLLVDHRSALGPDHPLTLKVMRRMWAMQAR
ncbi:tetratricopeptide repeat protein [Streptomyces asoensis]|uniref:tetratricopeptide repeat protein n=1 Tax=Streptomyces asoensis TaxID=249586 RepID=UPI00332FF035